MRRPFVVIAAIWLLAGLPARAGDDWAESFASIRAAAASIHGVRAAFTQTKELAILARPLVSRGRFAFRAPDSIRWEYLSPVKSLLLSDRGKLSRWARRDGRWVPDASGRVEAMRVVIEEIQGWLKGRFEDSPTFSARLLPGRPRRVDLVPRDPAMAELIQKIVLTLAERPGELAAVEIVEGPGATTRIAFDAVELNPTLPADTFASPE